MPFDIYGDKLQPGCCEVHPWVNQEYPCSVCLSDRNAKAKKRQEIIKERQAEIKFYEDLQQKQNEEELSKWNKRFASIWNLEKQTAERLKKITALKEKLFNHEFKKELNK